MELSREKITAYLKDVSELETSRFIWREAMNDINQNAKKIFERKKTVNKQFNDLQQKMQAAEYEYSAYTHDIYNKNIENAERSKKFKTISSLTKFSLILVVILSILAGCALGKAMDDLESEIIMYIMVPFLIILWVGTPLLVVSIVFSVKSKRATRQTKVIPKETWIGKRTQDYTDSQQELTSLIEKEAQIKERQTVAFESLKAVEKRLNELYALNLIDEKYRKFQAVHTLYDYFKTGRCLVLEGPGGAIATYEEALDRREAIDLLYDIKGILTDISIKQDFLVYEMKRANNKLQRISNNTYEMKEYQRETNERLAHIDEFIDRYR